MPDRIRFFDSANVRRELAVADPPRPIVAADAGWRLLPERSPAMADLAQVVQNNPAIITGPLAATPVTFLHGDWKMGNLGTHPDRRTILIDWAFPGSGPPCWDLCWYLALNRARLPESKEATIARFHDGLTRHGVDCAAWFETQLDLCMIGIMAAFGWEKALSEDEELYWWDRRVADAVARQHLDVASTTD
jgi:aminoglycoside phosphotransferase (APT) family kinase protein